MSVLNEVAYPETWERVRLGAVATRVSETGFGSLEPLSVFLGDGVVPRSHREDNHNQLGADMEKYQRVLPGDLVFNKLRTWQGGFGVSQYSGIVSPAYIIARPGGAVLPGFLHHYMRSEPVLAELTRLSKWMPPSQFDIAWEDIRGVMLALPPLEEQRRIADFLDDQITRIDSLIALERQQVDLLAELLRALITATVTGASGLAATTAEPRPGARRRVSQIGSLGTPVKYLAHEVKTLNGDLAEQNLLSLSYGRIIRKDIESNEGLLPASFDRYTVTAPGDVVLRLTDLQNDQRSLRTGLVTEQGIITSAYLTLRPGSEVDSRWFAYALHAVDTSKTFYTLGGGLRQSMGMEEVGGLRLPVPPLEEQRRIADFLDDQVTRFGLTVAQHRSQADLLDEYRRSLITAAVTGELDVATVGRGVPA